MDQTPKQGFTERDRERERNTKHLGTTDKMFVFGNVNKKYLPLYLRWIFWTEQSFQENIKFTKYSLVAVYGSKYILCILWNVSVFEFFNGSHKLQQYFT